MLVCLFSPCVIIHQDTPHCTTPHHFFSVSLSLLSLLYPASPLVPQSLSSLFFSVLSHLRFDSLPCTRHTDIHPLVHWGSRKQPVHIESYHTQSRCTCTTLGNRTNTDTHTHQWTYMLTCAKLAISKTAWRFRSTLFFFSLILKIFYLL